MPLSTANPGFPRSAGKRIVYQLATDCNSVDKMQLFIQTCTSMMPTADNKRLVTSAANLMRSVMHGADIMRLREFVLRADEWCADVDDIMAAAGQAVIDELDAVSRVNLHDVIRRVAQIERVALAAGGRRAMEGHFHTAYAG